jgi:hypothetical protein
VVTVPPKGTGKGQQEENLKSVLFRLDTLVGVGEIGYFVSQATAFSSHMVKGNRRPLSTMYLFAEISRTNQVFRSP